MLQQLVETLQWKRPDSFPDSVYALFVERLSQAFRATFSRLRASEPDRVSRLMDVFASDGEVVRRFLTAPETFHQLARNNDDRRFLSYAETAVEAELCRSGKSQALDRNVWTPLGDFCASGTHAPVVDHIPIDFESPYSRVADVPIAGPFAPFDPEARQQVLDRLGRSLQNLNRMSRECAKVVRLFTAVIVARLDTTRPNAFLSSSSPRYPGATVLCNPHCATPQMLSEAVLHEAIHSLMCGIQLQEPFVLDHRALSHRKIASPWTGKMLAPDAFVEACFVWFGLWHFWSIEGTGNAPATPEGTRLRQRSIAGFGRAKLSDMVRSMESVFTADAFNAIDAMQAIVARDLKSST